MTCATRDDLNVRDVKELLPWMAETPIRDILGSSEEKSLRPRMEKKRSELPLELPGEVREIVKTKSLVELMERILQ